MSSHREAAVRRQLLEAYRQVNDQLTENEAEMVSPGSDALVKQIRRANELLTQVRTPIEGTKDADTMISIARMGKKKALELKTETNHFSAIEFASRLKAYLLSSETQLAGEEKITRSNWIDLGKAVQNFYKHPPSVSFLLGTFANEPPAKKEKAKRQRVKDDNSKDKKTTIREIVDDDVSEESTSTDVTQRVLPALIKLYKYNDDSPIDYFEFVVDPTSFGATIENMFHVSFLIRDGLVSEALDEEGIPALKPTIYGLAGSVEGREAELANLNRKQTVKMITMQEWQNIVSVWKIKKARIPRRKKT